MDEILPLGVVALFTWGLVTAVRTIAEARTRKQLLEANVTPEYAAAIMAPIGGGDLAGSLKWGIVTTGVAIALMVASYLEVDDSAFGLGIVLLGAGLGLLTFYSIAKRQQQRLARA